MGNMIKWTHEMGVPKEIETEDVYDILYFFDNEDEAVVYISNYYNFQHDRILTFIEELHSEDEFRVKFGVSMYPRTAHVNKANTLILEEMLNGKYLLWECY